MSGKKVSKIHQRVQTAVRENATTSRKFDRMIANDMQVDTSGDAGLLKSITQKWEDLNGLRETLASTVMEFTTQVYGMAQHPQIQLSLGDKKGQFEKLLRTFFADMEGFSSKIAALRAEHEGRSGKIETMDDYGTFNKLSLRYQNVSEELNVLLAPTLSELVLIVNECSVAYHLEQEKLKQQAALTDPAVVSDIQVKEA